MYINPFWAGVVATTLVVFALIVLYGAIVGARTESVRSVGALAEMYVGKMDVVKIYNMQTGKNIFIGSFNEAMVSEYANDYVEGFTVIDGTIHLNIRTK